MEGGAAAGGDFVEAGLFVGADARDEVLCSKGREALGEVVWIFVDEVGNVGAGLSTTVREDCQNIRVGGVERHHVFSLLLCHTINTLVS